MSLSSITFIKLPLIKMHAKSYYTHSSIWGILVSKQWVSTLTWQGLWQIRLQSLHLYPCFPKRKGMFVRHTWQGVPLKCMKKFIPFYTVVLNFLNLKWAESVPEVNRKWTRSELEVGRKWNARDLQAQGACFCKNRHINKIYTERRVSKM